MNYYFKYSDGKSRGYCGCTFEHDECCGHLQKQVKDSLLDVGEIEDTLSRLQALKAETGFEASEELLADILSLEDPKVDVQNFRIGEAFAEIILNKEFSCRFHWNELRDARNPRGNKTGADLVGFIEIEGNVLFLFGEVKTSSEVANRPPQVMTNADGIEKQLLDLYRDREKRRILIAYLKNKIRNLPPENPFRQDFELSERSYYSKNNDYHLTGVLVRDVDPDEKDLKPSYDRLKSRIVIPQGIQLIALYLPIKQLRWLSIINDRPE